jgi:excisionase family DNA binding protein
MTEHAMKVRDVAREYGVTPSTVYRWLSDGDLPSFRLPGGDHRFRREHLEEFEARCRERSSIGQTIVSAKGAESGSSTGPSPVALDPFRRGRLSARALRDGGTNG